MGPWENRHHQATKLPSLLPIGCSLLYLPMIVVMSTAPNMKGIIISLCRRHGRFFVGAHKRGAISQHWYTSTPLQRKGTYNNIHQLTFAGAIIIALDIIPTHRFREHRLNHCHGTRIVNDVFACIQRRSKDFIFSLGKKEATERE